MKSKKNLLEQLKSLPHFSKDSLSQLGKQLGLADATVDTYISRFLKRKEIFQHLIRARDQSSGPYAACDRDVPN